MNKSSDYGKIAALQRAAWSLFQRIPDDVQESLGQIYGTAKAEMALLVEKTEGMSPSEIDILLEKSEISTDDTVSAALATLGLYEADIKTQPPKAPPVIYDFMKAVVETLVNQRYSFVKSPTTDELRSQFNKKQIEQAHQNAQPILEAYKSRDPH